MGSIIELFFDNPIFIAILIGILTSFFRKGKNEDKKSTKTKPFVYREKIEEVKVKKEASHNKKTSSRSKLNEKTTKINEYKASRNNVPEGKIRQLRELENRQQIDLQPIKEIDRQHDDIQKSSEMKRDQILEGIIWSEVLAPPRSKRPYKPMNK